MEAREMLADDFGGPIAFDVLGARIPARDVTAHIQGKNSVVPHPRHDLIEVAVDGSAFRARGLFLAPAVASHAHGAPGNGASFILSRWRGFILVCRACEGGTP